MFFLLYLMKFLNQNVNSNRKTKSSRRQETQCSRKCGPEKGRWVVCESETKSLRQKSD